MIEVIFEKLLSRTDCNQSFTHQSGMLVPKTVDGLLLILPFLDKNVKNPREFINCVDEFGEAWTFTLIYYNNKLHDEGGTRNEYRLSGLHRYLKARSATAGDCFQISKPPNESHYRISVIAKIYETSKTIRLRGWRKIH